jgi:thiol-disulfide isomerase/thioredoxin
MKVLRFGAVWCPSCIIMKSRWQKIEKELTWLKTEYYDYDQDKEVVKKYNIGRDIPIFVFLDKEGNEFERMKGEIDRKDLIKFLEANKDK